MLSIAFTATAAISSSLSRVIFAEALLRRDLIVIDGLGYLPSSQGGAHDIVPVFSRLEFVPAVGLALSGGLSDGARRGAIDVVERLILLRVDCGREVPSRSDEHCPASPAYLVVIRATYRPITFTSSIVAS